MSSPAENRYRPLAQEDYQEIADESSLKGLLRVRGHEGLMQETINARGALQRIQTRLVHRAWRYPVRELPLMLCKGPARSGASYIRWRNYNNNRSGTLAWQELVQHPHTLPAVREALLAIEQDRIVFNMQMSITTFILRQLRECTVKMREATESVRLISSSSTQRSI